MILNSSGPKTLTRIDCNNGVVTEEAGEIEMERFLSEYQKGSCFICF